MNKRFLLLSFVIFNIASVALFAQYPINYQGVLRDIIGNPYPGQDIAVRFSIIEGATTVLYIETQAITTSDLGYINTTIGEINPTEFEAIEWGNNRYSLKVEIDHGQNGSWEISETRSLSSVPYASHAKTSGRSLNDTIWKVQGTHIYYNGASAGIGEISPKAKFTVLGEALSESEGSRSNWLRLAGNTGNTENIYFYNNRHTAGNGWESSELVIQKQVDNTPMHYIAFKGLAGDDSKMVFGYSSSPLVTIDKTGRVGIGTSTPSKLLDVAGDVSMGYNVALWNENKALHLRQDPANSWVSNIGNFVGNGSETNGSLNIVGEGGLTLRYGQGAGGGLIGLLLDTEGRIGIGTTSPESKLQIQGESSWEDNEPLFEVKNSDGVPVFAVYNNGVRILVEDDPDAKGRPRGGFSVGGFDRSVKGYTDTYDFMRISPDSIRFNINNSAAKGPRGGFAVGGFDRSVKGPINEDFMYLTPGASDDGMYNTFVGYHTGLKNTGDYNTLMGYNVASNLSGNDNVIIGYLAGRYLTSGGNNVFIGKSAGASSNGSYNVFLGEDAGKNESGIHNVYIGHGAGSKTSVNPMFPYPAASYSTTVGYNSGSKNSGLGLVAIGWSAGLKNSGGLNTFVGAESGMNNLSAERNTFLGCDAGYNSTSGGSNVFIGTEAGYGNTTGHNNVFIGNRAGSTQNLDNRLIIDNSNTTSPLIYGQFDNNVVRIYGNLEYTGTLSQYSDLTMKQEVNTLSGTLDKIEQLRGVSFYWSDESIANLEMSDKRQLGVIAQEVELVYPELISLDESGNMMVDYTKLTPILLEAVKEQQSIITIQNADIETLKNELSDIKLMLSSIVEKQ